MPARRRTFFDRRIGERIRARREALGMSQTVLGKEAGVSHQQIQKYENGSNRISASALIDIVHVLRMELATIYEGLVQEYISLAGFSEPGQATYTVRPSIDDDTLRRLCEAYDAISDRKGREAVAYIAERLALAEHVVAAGQLQPASRRHSPPDSSEPA